MIAETVTQPADASQAKPRQARPAKTTQAKSKRPQKLTKELKQRILAKIVNGDSLRQLCKDPSFPTRDKIRQWRALYPEFSKEIDARMESYADFEFDRVKDIEDKVLDGELPCHSARVVLDSIKWRLGVLNRNRYGDRQTLEIDASDKLLERIQSADSRLLRAKRAERVIDIPAATQSLSDGRLVNH